MKTPTIALTASALGLVLWIGIGDPAARAADAAKAVDAPHSFAAKREFATLVIGCMRKRMANDKSISYNRAAKACKAEVARQMDASEPGPLVAADAKP